MNGIETGTAGGRPGVGRRTLAKGATWAVPAIAVAGSAPAYAGSKTTTTSTTLPPCVSDVAAVGGTYPVTYDLSGCQPDGTHWDFQFRIQASERSGTDCDCSDLRITLFDNPKRTRLWIISDGQGGSNIPDPSTNNLNSPRLYVQKTITPGGFAVFPEAGDGVYRVAGPAPYAGYTTGGSFVGTIDTFGDSNDTLHVLMDAEGTLPCSSSGPMAYYTVECRQTPSGSWTQLGGLGTIGPCVPMIKSTVCRTSSTDQDLYRLSISVRNSCGLGPSAFQIREVRRNSNDNALPGPAAAVWTGNVSLATGTADIITTNSSISGSELWIGFTTDNDANRSWIRVDTTTTDCPPPPTVIVSATNNQTTCPAGNRTINVTWTGPTTKIQYRVADNSGNFSGNWTNQDDTSSPGTISLSGSTKCRAVQVRVCNGGGANQTCDSASSVIDVAALSAPRLAQQQQVERPTPTETTGSSATVTPKSSVAPTTEPSTTETGGPTPSQPPTGSGG